MSTMSSNTAATVCTTTYLHFATTQPTPKRASALCAGSSEAGQVPQHKQHSKLPAVESNAKRFPYLHISGWCRSPQHTRACTVLQLPSGTTSSTATCYERAPGPEQLIQQHRS
jgi:hypothetical protein